jgi:hypothetical protein
LCPQTSGQGNLARVAPGQTFELRHRELMLAQSRGEQLFCLALTMRLMLAGTSISAIGRRLRAQQAKQCLGKSLTCPNTIPVADD